MVAVMGTLVDLRADEPRGRRVNDRVEETLQVRTYPVADLVVPIPTFHLAGPGTTAIPVKKPEFAELERHLRELTGTAAWNEKCSIKSYEQTLSLVIRQTSSVHEKIADELNRLRRQLDVQAALEIRVITGPRNEIAALAEAFPGELGQFETEQLRQRIAASKSLNLVTAPKVTVFSRQTVQIHFDGRAIPVNAAIAEDRRSVRLNIAEGPEQNQDILANVQTVQLHSGRSAALQFEAERRRTVIPPAADAVERLVVVTARVLVTEEEEEQQKVVLTVPGRVLIQEEEEELLGIPTE